MLTRTGIRKEIVFLRKKQQKHNQVHYPRESPQMQAWRKTCNTAEIYVAGFFSS